LIAEDEATIRNVTRIALEREGYHALTAENGGLALHLSQRYPGQIHFLLSDITMPKMNGIALSIRISKERPSIQIVRMSGGFAGNLRPKFPFLQKPFAIGELRDTIKGLIQVFR